MTPPPVVLCILDGWGLAPAGPGNAVAHAHTPVWDRLTVEGPAARLDAAAAAVGLPAGQMGNSEVGHMTIGAGRILPQDLPRIDAAIAKGALVASPVLARLIARLKAAGGTCHLPGLLSPGGVHSHAGHMHAIAEAVAAAGVPVAVHAFLDGRDTPPRSARGFLADFEAATADMPAVSVATVGGRYYGMDRDGNWDRTARAWAALAEGVGAPAASADAAVAAAYNSGIGDEFVPPAVIGGHAGMADGDGLLMANFRADRAPADPRRAAGAGLHRVPAPARGRLRGGGWHDELFRGA